MSKSFRQRWDELNLWVDGEAPERSAANETEHEARPELSLLDVMNERGERMDRRFISWAGHGGLKTCAWIYDLLSVIVCLAVTAVLLLTVSYLPPFGSSDNPAANEVYERYVEHGLEETGAVNIVAGMILDYRAFDTLGESHVLFLAACCVFILLKKEKSCPPVPDNSETVQRDDILTFGARILFPLIVVFGIYVILNGHLSAGGGFSGGAILGAGLILFRSAFGHERTARFFTEKTFTIVVTASLLAYTALKCYSFYTGANGLPSAFPLGAPGSILSGGLILPLNICVGCVVACTMYAFYSLIRKGDI